MLVLLLLIAQLGLQLASPVQNVEGQLDSLREENKVLQHVVQDLLRDVQDLRERLEVQEQRDENILVAFTVAVSTDRTYSSRGKYAFEHVITNFGGAWSVGTNEFTCPFTGMYMFSLSSVSHNTRYNMAVLMMNGNQVMAAPGDGDRYATGSGTNVIMVECEMGAKLWVECEPKSEATCYVSGQQDYGYTTHFSGYLIRAYED